MNLILKQTLGGILLASLLACEMGGKNPLSKSYRFLIMVPGYNCHGYDLVFFIVVEFLC